MTVNLFVKAKVKVNESLVTGGWLAPAERGPTEDRDLERKSGRSWIRTSEGVSQQIYSLPRLATSVSARERERLAKKMGAVKTIPRKNMASGSFLPILVSW